MLFMKFVDCAAGNKPLGDLLAFLDGILNIIKILIPIALVLFGSIDLGKSVMAGKDEDIKKAQGTLMKRALAAIAVFFLGAIVQLLFSLMPEENVCLGYNGLDLNDAVYEEIA